MRNKEYIDTLTESSNSLYAIINDILDYSKIEAGKMNLEDSHILINHILRSTSKLFSAAAAKKGLKVELMTDFNDNAYVILDEVRLKQVLSNIIGNSVKFTDNGSIKIHATYEKAKNSLLITISDTGSGIKSEVLNNIFKPFVQVEEKQRNSMNGTGLGLSIVKKIVELMNGDLKVTSNYGKGSSFTIILPTKLAHQEINASSRLEKSSVSQYSFSTPFDILVVDDNSINRDLLQARLQKMGLEPTLCSSGKEAIQKCEDHDFDLVFMDIQMPDLDGYETTIRIKNKLKNKVPPIVALTANAFEDDRQKAYNTGMVAHISKPIKVKDLIEVLEKYKP